IDFDQITHLAVFGILYELDGSIQTREADYMEPGWRNVTSSLSVDLQKRLQDKQTKVVLTLTSFDNEIIEEIVLDPEAKARMIAETSQFVRERGFDGVNMDFEYVGTPEEEVRVGFTELMRD